ncbi:unnamed protein product, partial [Symbiodinium pilosum]
FAEEIYKYIQQAVQEAVRQALQGLSGAGIAPAAPQVPDAKGETQDGKGRKRRKRQGKGEAQAEAQANGASQQKGAESQKGKDKGKGGGKLSSQQATSAKSGVDGRGAEPKTGSLNKGKGNGNSASSPDSEGWTKVGPKPRPSPDKKFRLRAQDWDKPLLDPTKIAEKLEALQTGVKETFAVVRKPSAVLHVRVPQAFATDQLWKQFLKNPSRVVMQWLSNLHINALDAWGWKEEQVDKGSQLYGLIRILEPDITSVLALSGRDGIFLELTRESSSGQPKVAVKVNWVDAEKGENMPDYLSRMLRSAGDLGLAHRAGRLGHVALRSSTDLVERLLAPSFENIKMLRQLRKKKFKVFYFRAASKEADRDLVPLTARDGNDTLTLWATIAPPRNRVRQQRVLKGSSVLSLAPRTSIFEPQPVSIATCAEDGDKEQGVAKKAKTLARGVPTGCKVHIVPGDGSCELRAGVVNHLLQHKDRYVGLWDKCDTGGKPDPNLDFEGYIKLVGQESAYASDLELRALARSWQVNIVVVPADSRLEPEAFTTQKAKKTLAFWLENKHIDLLLPVEGNKYPEELFS